MSWQQTLVVLIAAVAVDALRAYLKKSPSYLLGPYKRLWKETWSARRYKDQFKLWKPEAARYVALEAIKARGKRQTPAKPVLELLESSLRRGQPIALLGEPGAGKTTAVQALTYRLAERAFRFNLLLWGAIALGLALAVAASILLLEHHVGWFARSPWIIPSVWLGSFMLAEPLVRRRLAPVFVQASWYPGGTVRDWYEEKIAARIGRKPLFGSRQRVAMIIDGVNEVPAQHYTSFIQGFQELIFNNQIKTVILASRAGEDPTLRLGLENAFTVCDLDDDGVLEFLKVYGRERTAQKKGEEAAHDAALYSAQQAQNDLSELRNKKLLGERGIGRNPYWLKMMVECGLYTPNRGKLFQGFAEKLIERELEIKPAERKRKPDWKPVPIKDEMRVLAALAVKMHEAGEIGFKGEAGWSDGREAIREAIADGESYSAEDVFGLARDATLLRWEKRELVEFSHQLVQEFFTAYKLMRDVLHGRQQLSDVLALKRIDDVRWWQPLLMLGGLLDAGEPRPANHDSYCRYVRMVLGQGTENAILLAVGLLAGTARRNDELRGEITSALSNSLKHGATPAHKRAARELADQIGSDSVADSIREMLSASAPEIKRAALETLGVIGGHKSFELLNAALSDSREDRTVRGSAAAALGQIGGNDATAALTAALRDKDSYVRRSVEKALGLIFEFETVTLNEVGEVASRVTGDGHHVVEELAPGVTLEMVEIPGGTFTMGSPKEEQGSSDGERPLHEVTVSPFHIGKFAVTQEQWRVVAGWPKVEQDLNAVPSHFKGDDRPVERVSWEDAVEFCERLSKKTGKAYRLPTEAEWEYACRAGTKTPFAFGETITPEFVNYDGNYPYGNAPKAEYREKTVPVGSLGVANGFGLYDMHGNVWEWCHDWYGPYRSEPATDPQGPSTGQYRGLRGGSWYYLGFHCRSACRLNYVPGFRDLYIGFRVVVGSRTQ
ncbi:MAG TPA: SUMF1/EgtB/PvdO family nonheme iron enzyme [Blastocatellia bacterium]|nr:SUMF1/EgtB/PvdO family nonheme iron enzyme [Blastocatellia bacterium]